MTTDLDNIIDRLDTLVESSERIEATSLRIAVALEELTTDRGGEWTLLGELRGLNQELEQYRDEREREAPDRSDLLEAVQDLRWHAIERAVAGSDLPLGERLALIVAGLYRRGARLEVDGEPITRAGIATSVLLSDSAPGEWSRGTDDELSEIDELLDLLDAVRSAEARPRVADAAGS